MSEASEPNGVKRASVDQSSNPDVERRLIDSLIEAERFDDARQLLARFVERVPNDFAAWQNLAGVEFSVGSLAAARSAAERAVALAPKRPRSWNLLGTIAAHQQEHAAGVEAFRKAVELDSGYTAAWHNLGNSLEALDRIAEAAAAFQKAGDLSGEDSASSFEAAALSGATPSKAPVEFVRRFYDAYASTFDQHLRQVLDYRAPERVRDLLDAERQWSKATVLELGCGTGLMGPLVRPWASRLVGVDASPAMLALARKRNAYDALELAEIVDWLGSGTEQFDLIVAVDVLICFGDLRPLFAACRNRLLPQGVLCFTIERSEPDCALDRSRRFTHSMSYVEASLTNVGLTIRQNSDLKLRSQDGSPVAGNVVLTKHSPPG